MKRERVDIFGAVRPMEPKDQIAALQIPPSEIGLIKEGPVKRWQTGQEQWDQKFKRRAKKVALKRKHYEEKAARLLEHAREQGLQLRHEQHAEMIRRPSTVSYNSTHNFEHERRWGE